MRVALLTLLALFAGTPAYSDDDYVYEVLPQDSLWKIAGEFLLDPERWPELWTLNQYIVNPDLIYAGDKIRWRKAEPVIQEFELVSLDDDSPLKVAQATNTPQATNVPELERHDARPSTRFSDVPSINQPYVDQLIDPDVEEDSFLAYVAANDSHGPLSAIDQSIELVGLYRQDNAYFDSTFDRGLHYIARMNTSNWGQLRLNLVALDEYGFSPRGDFTQGERYRGKSGLARLSIEQYNLPVTDWLSMDNVLGTHRQVRYNPFRERPNLINYRFSAAEPDVLGFSSQLKFGRSGVGLSVGKLGQTRGTILPGFERTEGDIKRVQFTHVRERHAISTDFWRTDNQTAIDNRTGFRLSYDHLLSNRTTVSLTGAASGDSYAWLAGGSTQDGETKHDYGVYYFGADMVWLDSRIGDDNAGSFYRFHTRRGRHTFGSSIELRRDGLTNSSSSQTDTGFFSLSVSRRIDRRSNISSVYNYRRVNFSGGGTAFSVDNSLGDDLLNTRRGSRQEHSLRSYYTRNHQTNARSNLGVVMRTREGSKEAQLNYGWSKDLNNDATLELNSSYRRSFDTLERSTEAIINGSWSKQFAGGSFFAMGLGYNQSRSALDSTRGVTGFVNLERPFSQRLALSLQLDYNRSQADYEFDEDISGTFFTENRFEEERLNGLKQFSALLSLTYRRGGRSQSTTLRGTGQGSGRVQGYVFVDNNRDGVRQPGEPGLAGITVFLNSVYPVVTDSQGAYRFPSVGLGEHFVFIDESTLPLPWTLAEGEYTPLSVQLRRTTKLNIAVSPINLADSG